MVLNFLILAFIIFLMVKAVNNLRKRLEREKLAAAAAPPPADVALLTEIRDLLAKDNARATRKQAVERALSPISVICILPTILTLRASWEEHLLPRTQSYWFPLLDPVSISRIDLPIDVNQ